MGKVARRHEEADWSLVSFLVREQFGDSSAFLPWPPVHGMGR